VNPVCISYFSDVLCIWAYISQIRVDELKKNFGEDVVFHQHFIPVFGCTAERIGEQWKSRGGFEAYSAHVKDVAGQFPHIEVNQLVWQRNTPASSASGHEFLKAIQILEQDGRLCVNGMTNSVDGVGGSVSEYMASLLRRAFFRDLMDVSDMDQLYALAEQAGLPVDKIATCIRRGLAMAALCHDVELCKRFKVDGSPTYVLNEGRQILYGNLGYKLLAANVREIMSRPEEIASWC